MRVTAEWAHRFVALTRMRPKPDVEHAPLPEREQAHRGLHGVAGDPIGLHEGAVRGELGPRRSSRIEGLPTTLSAVLIFVALLGPGYLYVRRIEVLGALYKVSPFRETVAILIVSMCCNGVALALFSLARVLFPGATPDVGAIIRGEPSYLAKNYSIVLAYSIAVYAVALLIAFGVSHPAIRASKIWHSRPARTLIGESVLDRRSAWTRLFDAGKAEIVRAACELDDGSWVDGWVYSWNAQPEEDSDRTLTLYAPIRVRPAGEASAVPLAGIAYSVVSSGDIVRLDVTHVDVSLRDVFNQVYETPP